MGSATGGGPGGIFLLDHESFDVLGQWEVIRGPQFLAYDFRWHIGYDVAITSEWGTPDMFENGLSIERLVKGDYGHRLHMWDLRRRRHVQEIDLGAEHQLGIVLPQQQLAFEPMYFGLVMTVLLRVRSQRFRQSTKPVVEAARLHVRLGQQAQEVGSCAGRSSNCPGCE